MKLLLIPLSLLCLLLSSCSQATADVQTVNIDVEGMTCDACVKGITSAMAELPGMQECSVSLENGKATVTLDANKLTPDQAVTRINQLGFTAALVAETE